MDKARGKIIMEKTHILFIPFFINHEHNGGQGGVIRTKKFIKYLSPRFAITVLSIPQSIDGIKRKSDKGSIRWRFASSPISPYNHTYLSSCAWVPFAIAKSLKYCKRNIDVLYVSAPPFPILFVGVILKKLLGIPLVVDFRDGWTINPYNNRFHDHWLVRRIERTLEGAVFKNADKFIANTYGTKDEYEKLFPLLKEKTIVITNGYDEEDFIIPKSQDAEPSKVFTITHSGSFHANRNPETLFKALAEVNIPFRLIIIGTENDFVRKVAEKYGIQEKLMFLGLVSQKESIQWLQRSHLLFLIQGPTTKRCIPIAGKTFEYLRTRIPILYLGPEGDNAQFIRDCSENSYVLTNNDVNEVMDAICDCYNDWFNHITKLNGRNVIKFAGNYSRSNLTKILEHHFNKVCSDGKHLQKDI